MLAGTPIRHVAETLGTAESLLGKWKRQYEQQGDDALPGHGKQRGESAELATPATGSGHHGARWYKKGARSLLAAYGVRVPRHRGVGWSLSRGANVPAAAGITQRLLCLAAATTFDERDGKSAT